MKKIVALLLSICMILSMVSCGNANSNQNNSQEQESTEEVLEIESLEYWLAKVENPDEVLLSFEEIQKENALMMQWWGKDWESGYYDINAFPEKIERAWLQERIEYPNVKNLGLYCKGKKVTAEQWQEYYKNYNYANMPATITVKYGVIVNSTASYDFPIADIMTGSELNEAENLLQQTYFRMNEPVVVLWESADKEWYYVVANEFIGWIPSKDCALFENRADWKAFQEDENFLIVTQDSKLEGIADKVFMSTKLYLIAEDEPHDLIHGDYIVRVPQRGENGMLHYTYAALSKEDHVHDGYLSYTTKNILTLAFQELGDPYGWGGIDGKRDCSIYIKDIYNCFGFLMPRNSQIQMNIPEMRVKTEELSVAEKEAILDKTNPGAILGFKGHVMLYLGKAGGQHYVISMLGSYVPETVTEDFGNHIESVQRVMINTLDVKRRSGNTWLQEIISIVDIK